MADTPTTAHPLAATWLALGARCAAASGALCALLSLYADAPVWVASLRGAGVWFVVRLLVRLTARLALASLDTPSAPSTNDQ